MFQYESAIDAFNTKIRNLLNSFKVQRNSHARILRRHWQYQHSINQGTFNKCQYALNQNKEVPPTLSPYFVLHQMCH